MSRTNDTPPLIQLSDVPAALGLLSRLPIRVDVAHATKRSALAAWAYPVAGLVIALIAGCVAQVTLSLGLPSAIVAGLTLTTLVITTGALHEDGFADSADGLWGGWDTERRLDIMKDSHIGAYGVIALVIGLGLRWQALTELAGTSLWVVLIVVAMISRAAMVSLMCLLPNARTTGLSHSVGQPSIRTATIAWFIATIVSLVLLQTTSVLLVFMAMATTALCAKIAMVKIGGQTGDILGATQQLTETALLIALATVL